MVEVAHQHRKRRFSVQETRRVVGFVLQKERRKRWNVSVVFTDDRFIKRINLEFLGYNEVTDVLAFPLRDGLGLDAEVYVNLDRARSQAIHYHVERKEEIRRLLVHGVLHLAGYRDATVGQRSRMVKREDHLLSLLGKGA